MTKIYKYNPFLDELDIVLDIMSTKQEEADAISESKAIKEHNDKIMNLIAEKQDEDLKKLSKKELEKLLK